MSQSIKVMAPIRLKDFNPDFHDGLDKADTAKKTDRFCARIGELQHLLYADAQHALLIVLQGMDTSGKDGTVKHVLDAVNPAGVETANFKGPSREELAHDFLWRIPKAGPRYGKIGGFNRSHYEDVFVVRVLKLQPEEVLGAPLRANQSLRKNALRESRDSSQILFAHQQRRAGGTIES